MTSGETRATDAPTAEELIAKGQVCLENGDASQARELFEAAIQLSPDATEAHVGLGRALTARRRYVEAEALYVDMENRKIAPIEARLGRARLRSLQGDHEGARRYYRDVVQADPSNLEARLGLVREEHVLGLDNQALPQIDSLVQDHPESDAARRLQKRIHDDLRPHIGIAPEVRHDDGGNRLSRATAFGSFMADPQTEVTVAVAGIDTTADCNDAIDCAAFTTPPTTDPRVTTESRSITGGTVIRIARPLVFEARLGFIQEEPLDGGDRTLLYGDGVIRWDVGPRLALRGTTERRPLIDSAALVDRGIRLDTGTLSLSYRLHPLWIAAGTGELGRYSDGNARESLETTLTFRGTVPRPTVLTTAAVRLRRHNDDRDMGYLDPIRYDSETITVTLTDEALNGRFTWTVAGTWGRQSYDPNEFETAAVGQEDTPLTGGSARVGVGIGDRTRLEAWHQRTNDALATAPGFPVRISGLSLKVRL
ncbi:MAG TPA: tetratricopeptide repeat protein [Candidatus Polarisedimenticolia bacterium]|nr:tetratricopeptide repeat protein [Candidatus Polarisedimenticolia bacterium]